MSRESFKSVLEEILQLSPGSLGESDTRHSIETWSSLADVEILTVVSSEFGVDAELVEYETVGELLTFLEQRRAFAA